MLSILKCCHFELIYKDKITNFVSDDQCYFECILFEKVFAMIVIFFIIFIYVRVSSCCLDLLPEASIIFDLPFFFLFSIHLSLTSLNIHTFFFNVWVYILKTFSSKNNLLKKCSKFFLFLRFLLFSKFFKCS